MKQQSTKFRQPKLQVILSFFSALVLLIVIEMSAFSQDSQTNRVLFLGNSVFFYHGGIYQSFLGFCKTEDLDFQAISQRREPENTHGAEFLRMGRVPTTLPEFAAKKKFHTLIREGNFDYIILEARREGHLLPEWLDRSPDIPGWVDRFIDYEIGESILYQQNVDALGKLHRTIVESGAQMVLYMHPGVYWGDWKYPLAQIYERFRDDLAAREINGGYHDVILVPTSLLWRDAINRFGKDAWYDDHIHGSAIARYASGCLVFTYITGKDPRNNSFRELPKGWRPSQNPEAKYVSEANAKWIKEQIWLYYSTRRR